MKKSRRLLKNHRVGRKHKFNISITSRIWGLGFIALSVLIILWSMVVGTVADSDKALPTSPAEGFRVQLHLTEEGRKVVRCAAIFDFPAAKVWKVVTNYGKFHEVFPHLSDVLALLFVMI